jgi:hypothetical protein
MTNYQASKISDRWDYLRKNLKPIGKKAQSEDSAQLDLFAMVRESFKATSS